MAWAAAIGAGAGIGSAFLDRREQRQANQQNRAWQLEDQAWSERMSNSAYQRAMADMRKAGLNPILAAHQGGASTPSAGSSHAEAGKVNPGVQAAVSSAQQIRLQRAEANVNMQNTATVTQKTAAEADYIRAQTEDLRARMPHTGNRAYLETMKLKDESDKLAQEWNKLVAETGATMDRNERENQMFTLLKRAHELDNEARELDLPEKRATAKFWSQVPQAKYLDLINKAAEAAGNVGLGVLGARGFGRGGLRGLFSPKYPKGTIHYDPKTGEMFDYKHNK